ncbi:MAG: transposase, partial [Gemmatimonadaceae bacterium]|nr:transposase [Chitinophagaceae bacterium]
MAEKKSSQNNSACYYVTFNVTDWIGLFVRPAYKQAVVESLNSFIESKGLVVYAWCLMSNHLHLLTKTRSNINFSVTVRALKKDISKKLFALMATEPDIRKEWMLTRFEMAGHSMKRIEKYQLWQNCSNPVHIDFTNKQLLWDHIRYIHE